MNKEEFKKRFPVNLNDQQWEAVRAVEGPTLLLAVPGSGKTTVLVARIGYMIHCCNIRPESIMTITYTKAAAIDMSKRFAKIFGDDLATRIDFRTINSLCLDIIRYCAQGKRVFDIISDNDSSHILRELYIRFEDEFPTESDLSSIKTSIAFIKNGMLTKDEISSLPEADIIHIGEIYDEYNRILRSRKQMDFDDQMIYALGLMSKRPDVLKYYQSRYPYFCVDEAQDTSKIQHRIISLLSSGSENLFMVGDEDQSIYGFRAAYPKALLSFEKDHNNAKVLLMENNFRSDGNIVSAADGFIQKNVLRHKKSMKAARPSEKAVKTISLRGRRAQYSYITKIASDCREQTAVLYRYNESVIPIVDIFERQGIRYQIKNKDISFFTSRVVRDITQILHLADEPDDTEAFMQVYYKIGTYLKKKDAETACFESKKRNISILDAAIDYCGLDDRKIGNLKALRTHFKNMSHEDGDKAVNRAVSYMGYDDYMERNQISDRKIIILKTIGSNEKSPAGLIDRLTYLQHCLEEKETDRDCPFILSTIHSSKGLEYDNVYLMDVEDGIFPETIPKNIKNASQEELEAYEEERRIFYVGVTRAKNSLSIFEFGKGSTFTDQLIKKKKTPPKVPQNNRPAVIRPFVNRYEKPVVSDEKIREFLNELGAGIIVEHKKFGKGVIVNIDKEKVKIDFDGEEKTFITSFLVSSGLLKLL